jgi:hypothetical protein
MAVGWWAAGRDRWIVLATSSNEFVNPRSLGQTAAYDVASTVHQSLAAGCPRSAPTASVGLALCTVVKFPTISVIRQMQPRLYDHLIEGFYYGLGQVPNQAVSIRSPDQTMHLPLPTLRPFVALASDQTKVW